jgi:hypothetical protein
MLRNQWPTSIGMGGPLRVESAYCSLIDLPTCPIGVDRFRYEGCVDRSLADKLDTAHLVLAIEMDGVESLSVAGRQTSKRAVNVFWVSYTIWLSSTRMLSHKRHIGSIAVPGVAVE